MFYPKKIRVDYLASHSTLNSTLLTPFFTNTAPCSLPLGSSAAQKLVLPLYIKLLPFALNVEAVPTSLAQLSLPLEPTAQLPFDDRSENFGSSSKGDCGTLLCMRKVAQVPLVYHVPPEMRQPFESSESEGRMLR